MGFKFEYIHDLGNNIFIDDINISGTTGAAEYTDSFAWNVYPNPVQSAATVGFNLNATHDILIDVVDVLGRRVNEIDPTRLGAGEYQFELPIDISNGIYTVRIFVDGIPSSKKVVVQK